MHGSYFVLFGYDAFLDIIGYGATVRAMIEINSPLVLCNYNHNGGCAHSRGSLHRRELHCVNKTFTESYFMEHWNIGTLEHWNIGTAPMCSKINVCATNLKQPFAIANVLQWRIAQWYTLEYTYNATMCTLCTYCDLVLLRGKVLLECAGKVLPPQIDTQLRLEASRARSTRLAVFIPTAAVVAGNHK